MSAHHVFLYKRLAPLLPVVAGKEALAKAELLLDMVADLVDGGGVRVGSEDAVRAGDESFLEFLGRGRHHDNALDGTVAPEAWAYGDAGGVLHSCSG